MSCFYEQGLCFTCQPNCRYCCGVEPGYVFLSLDDIDRLTAHLALSKAQFLHTYCRKVPMGLTSYVSLIERSNHDCIFLTQRGCSVYEARPIQCATYPFWATIVDSRESWEQEKQWCPGIDIGRRYSKEEIEHLLELRVASFAAVWEEVIG